jgi:DNA invertase Pin-like site-specific DNA recombinase
MLLAFLCRNVLHEMRGANDRVRKQGLCALASPIQSLPIGMDGSLGLEQEQDIHFQDFGLGVHCPEWMEAGMIYGYARVSTEQQDYDAQVAALRAAGAEKIVAEKITGATLDRRSLVRLIARLAPGDRIVVTRLDRLARSTRDLLNVLGTITERGATFGVLDNPALDTGTAHGALLISMLGAIATFEREMILARTSEGRKRARQQGVRFGRPSSLSTFQANEAKQMREEGKSLQEIGRMFGVSHSTISRLGKL